MDTPQGWRCVAGEFGDLAARATARGLDLLAYTAARDGAHYGLLYLTWAELRAAEEREEAALRAIPCARCRDKFAPGGLER